MKGGENIWYHESFERMILPYQHGLYAFLRHLCGQNAEDAYQETLLAAWEAFKFNRLPDKLEPYLYGVARYKAMDALRERYRHEKRQVQLNEEVSSSQEDLAQEEMLTLNAALQKLKDEDRALLYLIFNQGMEYKRAGMVMGIPEGTVKSRVFSIKKKLRSWMGDEEDGRV